jgi:hypothetical protein
MRLSLGVGVVAAVVAFLMGRGHGGASSEAASASSVVQEASLLSASPLAGSDPSTPADVPTEAPSNLVVARQTLIRLWEDEAVTNPRFDRLSNCDSTPADSRCDRWRVEAEFSMMTRVAVDRLAEDDDTWLGLLSDRDVRVRLLALRALEVSGYRGRLPTQVYRTLDERSLVEVAVVFARHLTSEPTSEEGDAILKYAAESTDSRILQHAAIALATCSHRERLERLIGERSVELDGATQRLVEAKCPAEESPR